MVVYGNRRYPSPSGKVISEVSSAAVSWIEHQKLDVYGYSSKNVLKFGAGELGAFIQFFPDGVIIMALLSGTSNNIIQRF